MADRNSASPFSAPTRSPAARDRSVRSLQPALVAHAADIKGAALNIAFSCLGIFISLGLSAWYRLQNRSRDRKEHGPVAKPGEDEIRTYFDKAGGYRYTP